MTPLEAAALTFASSAGWVLQGNSPPSPTSTLLPPTDCLAGVAPGFLPAMAPTAQDISYYNARCAYFDRMAGTVPPGSVLLIGDSHFDGVCPTSIHPAAVGYGIGGDTWRGLLNRVNRGGANNPIHRAGACVLLLGVNDISWEGSNYATNIPYMIDMLAPWMTGRWVVCKIMPIDEARFSPPVTNAKIDTINGYLQTKFHGRSGVVVMDMKPDLAPTGQLLPQYSVDGLHLGPAGYSILAARIAAAIRSLTP